MKLKSYISFITLILFSCRDTSTKQMTTVKTTDTVATAIKPGKASFTLNVIPIPTADTRSDSDSATISPGDYPATFSIDATSFNEQLAAYGGACNVWIGPKGWTGNAEKSADGTTRVWLYTGCDTGLKGPHVCYTEYTTCQGCIFEAAAVYFPEARKEYNQMMDSGTADIPIPHGLQTKQMTPNIVTWSLPEKDGLITMGMSYYTAPDDKNDAYYMEGTFVLPKEQAQLATCLINLFISKFRQK